MPVASRQLLVRITPSRTCVSQPHAVFSVLFPYDALITFDRQVVCFPRAIWKGSLLLVLANMLMSLPVSILWFVLFARSLSDQVSEMRLPRRGGLTDI